MSGGRNRHRAVPALSSDPGTQTGHDERMLEPQLVGHQSPQAGTGALGDLAVLLGRPAVPPAELARLHLQPTWRPAPVADRRLSAAHRASRCSSSWRRIASCSGSARTSHELHARARRRSERHGALERRLHRAAPGERAAAIVDAREEALLETFARCSAARRTSPAASVRDELERRLAVAVLEVLLAQPVAVHAQQQLAPGATPPAPPPRPGRSAARRAGAGCQRRVRSLVFAASIG